MTTLLSSVASTARKRYGIKHSPRYDKIIQVGNYTVALIPSKRGGMPKAIGVAKRNPTDKYNPEIGIRVAYNRALKMLATETNAEVERATGEQVGHDTEAC